MPPEYGGVERPLFCGESLPQAAGEKNGFDATQAEGNHGSLDGLGRLRQAEQGGTGETEALPGNGVVVRHQAYHFVHLHVFGGLAQQLQQGQKDCRDGGHGFDLLHALTNLGVEGCSHSLPLLRDGFQYAMVPGKWIRENWALSLFSASEVPRKKKPPKLRLGKKWLITLSSKARPK